MNELCFNCNTKYKTNKKIKLDKLNILKQLEQEVDFSIIINKKLFFHEPYFPILEFFMQINDWINEEKETDFAYKSIETEENPLLSFIYVKTGWKLQSPWEQFESDAVFSKQTILTEIDKIKKIINVR